MEATLLEQGFTLMLVGMGTVFVFLTLLVGATLAMSALIRKFYPTPDKVAADGAQARAVDESEVVAAIAAALTLHKNR